MTGGTYEHLHPYGLEGFRHVTEPLGGRLSVDPGSELEMDTNSMRRGARQTCYANNERECNDGLEQNVNKSKPAVSALERTGALPAEHGASPENPS